MSNITYTVSQGFPGDVSSFEIIDSKDGQLVDQTVIQSRFNPQTDKVEAHFYSLDGTLLQSFRDFTEFVIPRGKINKDQDIIELNLDPQEDTVRAGFTNGDVYIIYNFLRRALKTENSREANLFIDAISPDRTEIRAILATGSERDSELVTAATFIKERIETSEFLEQFVLNFSGNRLLVGVNIDTVRTAGVSGIVVKLYQPLPDDLGIKDLFTLEEIVSDSVLFEVESEVTIEPTVLPSLRGPNFDVADVEDDRNPTEFLTLSQLLPSGSSDQLQAILQEKGIELGIDYSNFENFIFFSSAKERVENFLYKVELISGSTNATEIQNVKNKFDHFEKYLYFTDEFQGKDENIQNTYLQQAELYDELNFNKLTNSIPSFILEDSRNLPYLLFVDMVAQHFDNIWIYADGLTDRYKADNRLDYGISKDLVKEAVENLGINLYRSNKSVESLFSIFQGETYVSESEEIDLPIKQFPVPTEVTQVTASSSGSVAIPATTAAVDFDQTSIFLRTGEMLQTFTGADAVILDGFKQFDEIGGKYARIQFDYTISAYEPSLPASALGFVIDIPQTTSIEVLDRDAQDPNPITGSVDTGYIYIPENSTPRISISVLPPAGGILTGDTHQDAFISNISVVYISETLQPIAKNDYLKEIYKRVYHNIPLLLKSKGTERGLRSLINCFGIPDNILDIQVYENTPLSFNRPNQVFDFTTSSLDRIRIQSSASLVEGDILSIDTSIQTYDTIYDENLSTVEIGFSPTDNVNNFISGSFESLDDLIGDPSDYARTSYNAMQTKAVQVLGNTNPYNVQEFVRLIKFYDNALFRIVQEFIPARTDLVSGIVIKPHLLERSKRKGTTAKWIKFFTNKNPEAPMDFEGADYGKNFQLEGDIEVGNLSAGDTGVFPKGYSTSYISSTALGTNNEQARFTGELENSQLTVVSTDVSARNRFKFTSDQTLSTDNFTGSDYDVAYNNIQESRRSTFRRESQNLLNAAVQDSNYTDTGLSNVRYNGSVASPTFTTSSSDPFNSEKADYPIIRLTSVEGLVFERSFPDAEARELIKNPIDQLNLKTLSIATFSRNNINQGLRQVESNRLRIELELPLSSSQSPAVQTFVFEEVEGKLKRLPTKKILFVQQNKFGITNEVGKLLGTTSGGTLPATPPANSAFTRVFITQVGSFTAGLACSQPATTVEKFMEAGIISLDSTLVGKVLFNSSSLSGSQEFNGQERYYGISFFQNEIPVTSIKVDATGSITEAQECSAFDFGESRF